MEEKLGKPTIGGRWDETCQQWSIIFSTYKWNHRMNSIHDGTVLVLSEYRLEYYGGLLLLLLLLHISIKLFFSSVFLLSLSRYLLLFCAPLQLLLCMVFGLAEERKNADVLYLGYTKRKTERIFFFISFIWIFIYSFFISPFYYFHIFWIGLELGAVSLVECAFSYSFEFVRPEECFKNSWRLMGKGRVSTE